MILRPRPALARKAAVSNPDFSSSTNEGPPSDCDPDKDEPPEACSILLANGFRIFLIRPSIHTTLSAAHLNPNFSTGFHRGAAGFCSILLTFMEIFSRLLGAMIPLMEADEVPWDTAIGQASCRRMC